jgi:hypothetical protein
VIPDPYILRRRARVLHELPKMLPASVVMSLTEGDVDALDLAQDRSAYWRTLNAIVTRLQSTGKPHETA